VELFYRASSDGWIERNPFPLPAGKSREGERGEGAGRKKLSRNPKNGGITAREKKGETEREGEGERERRRGRGRERDDEKSLDRCVMAYEGRND